MDSEVGDLGEAHRIRSHGSDGHLAAALSAGKPHILFVESPPLGLAFTAWLLKRLWRIPFVYDVMDYSRMPPLTSDAE